MHRVNFNTVKFKHFGSCYRYGMELSARGSEPWAAIKQELVSWLGIHESYHQVAGIATYFSMIFEFQVTMSASLLDTNLR